MVPIAISQAAFDAVAATLVLGTVAVEPERDEDGSVHIWLDPSRPSEAQGHARPWRDLQRRDHPSAKGEREVLRRPSYVAAGPMRRPIAGKAETSEAEQHHCPCRWFGYARCMVLNKIKVYSKGICL
jgi:hypothetical protein